MTNKMRRWPRPVKARQLLTVCYGMAAVFWALWCVVSSGIMLNYRMRGQMPTLTLTENDLFLTSYGTRPDYEGWLVSTDADPHLYWEQTAYVETVRLHVEHALPPGAVALYYLRPGQTDYSEQQKIFADITAEGEYTFDLGGRVVSALRIDPDSRGGVLTRLTDVQINPVTPWYLRFVPSTGMWVLLLFAPALAAAWLAALLRRE